MVLEARMDKSRGPMATVLVQTGTLRVGDNVVVGTVRGRVKALANDAGRRIKAAGPSAPESDRPERGPHSRARIIRGCPDCG